LMAYVLLQQADLGSGIDGARLAEAGGEMSSRLRGYARGPVIATISVVIAAHNEHEYMARTLEGIFRETPASVLKEIIVVDDASAPPLFTVLTDYPNVKVIRNEVRKGLIKSKTVGGNAALGDSIMFLDGHIKPEPNWYVPILRHMNQNYKRVVVPIIPILDKDTWVPKLNVFGVKMMFDWSLGFHWFEDGNDLVPCMSGGLFGITTKWWHESGEYDYGMNFWGGENIEQSIRIWTCGGEIYVARDSKISHVFRSKFPYSINSTEVYINKVRTVETWFDDYKRFFYEAAPEAKRFTKHMGDIKDRLELKKSLKCKPFQWYVDKFHNVFREKHMLPEERFMVKNSVRGLCLEITSDFAHLHEALCDEGSAAQRWTFAEKGKGLRNVAKDRCLDANAGLPEKEGTEVFLYKCYNVNNENQAWSFTGGMLRWQGLCVEPQDGAQAGANLQLRKCDKFLEKTGPYIKHDAKVQVG